MSEKEFTLSQIECAKLLGISEEEYNSSLKQIKGNHFFKKISDEKKDNILKKLGLTKKDLKKRVC